MTPPKHVTVLGAGLSGLTAAYKLITTCPGTQVTVIDSADRVGGWIKTTRHRLSVDGREGDVFLESGPRSIRPKGSPGAAGMMKLIVDLGLKDDIIPISKTHPSAQNRFILDSTTYQLHKLGLNPLSGAIPPTTILRAGLEPFVSRKLKPDESVHDFLTRRFGGGVSKLASAGMHGIYAASLEDLSAHAILGRVFSYEEKYGSVLWGLWRDRNNPQRKAETNADQARWKALGDIGRERADWAMYGLKEGLVGLVRRLEEVVRGSGDVKLRIGETVTRLHATGKGVQVTTASDSFETSHIISSVPLPALDPLIPSLKLPINPRTTVGVLSLVFPRSPAAIGQPNGFGYLIPRPSSDIEIANNPNGILGVVFDSTALPGMDTLEGITKLTIMFGGPYYDSYTPRVPRPQQPADLVQPALDHLRKVFPNLRGVEPILVESAIQKDCIPTYRPGHIARARELKGRIDSGEWRGKISMVGNEWKGIGVNNSVWTVEEVCVALAKGEAPTGLEGI